MIDGSNHCTSTNRKVGSNKRILGQGSSAGIKGIGLRIAGSSNVIVQNIHITDINAKSVRTIAPTGDNLQFVVSLDGASKVWIDHNHIQNIGRQFLVKYVSTVMETYLTIRSAGKEYFSTTAAYVSTCTSVLGHACQANQLVSSGSVSGADSSVLNTFGPEPAALRYVPMAASTVPAFVKDNAGMTEYERIVRKGDCQALYAPNSGPYEHSDAET
ncbi:related to pectin lyase-Aspergillus fumigatus [Serendipita indica DSM 11827]|uniref:pectin lyase n=1 Tax=Serendipita indica (strain DSM 11827) TaxID=1109443 RepID=G4TGB4_SERID|nr:related to pectin lyase-Aspergillus fumigatus [Serendipita indica DSM 11827]